MAQLPSVPAQEPTSSVDSPVTPSLAGLSVSRVSHSRKRPLNHIPRPPNAFIIFRSHFWELHKDTIAERDHRQISRIAGHQWKHLPPSEKSHFKELARERKILHALEFPEYKYQPLVRRKKSMKQRNNKDGGVSRSAMPSPRSQQRRSEVKEEAVEEAFPQQALSYTAASSPAPRDILSSLVIDKELFVIPETGQTPEIVESEDYSLDLSPQVEFVPTHDIPPLSLDATPKVQQMLEMDVEYTVAPASTYVDAAPQSEYEEIMLSQYLELPTFNDFHDDHDYTLSSGSVSSLLPAFIPDPFEADSYQDLASAYFPEGRPTALEISSTPQPDLFTPDHDMSEFVNSSFF